MKRFGEEPVVIMGDIESTFQQVLVPEYDHGISGTVGGFEM